jgi:hypothetical protein
VIRYKKIKKCNNVLTLINFEKSKYKGRKYVAFVTFQQTFFVRTCVSIIGVNQL